MIQPFTRSPLTVCKALTHLLLEDPDYRIPKVPNFQTHLLQETSLTLNFREKSTFHTDSMWPLGCTQKATDMLKNCTKESPQTWRFQEMQYEAEHLSEDATKKLQPTEKNCSF
ncbi:hypothetical protein JTE90_026089 [Oedothorax gibbosus]|uniref:Uncharacterized protein n=1 Tax=Oedothorax gibbosus TaxID=931172 RepID=A0AAV6UPD3_9ARAC|nr:hypothetical protein JTE90_026089 [Oedothorax gibbosus]